MFKLSLVLMLAATQLLAGSCKAVYLCINVDGEFCCLDAGPGACTCHHDDHQADGHTACEHGVEQAMSHSCGHEGESHNSKSSLGDETPELASLDSECTHQLVAAGHTASVGRTTASHDVLDALHFCSCIPDLQAIAFNVDQSAEGGWTGPPLMPSAALRVLSTVNIRC